MAITKLKIVRQTTNTYYLQYVMNMSVHRRPARLVDPRPFGQSGGMRDERRYVVEAISAFLDGSGGRRDWDDFTSCSLRDAELDRIRRCADAVDMPLDAEGRAALRELLVQAELVDGDDPTRPRPWRMEAGMVVGLLLGMILWWANHLQGAGLFHDLHLLVIPAAVGALVVGLRNSRKKVGVYDPRIVTQNRRGRV